MKEGKNIWLNVVTVNGKPATIYATDIPINSEGKHEVLINAFSADSKEHTCPVWLSESDAKSLIYFLQGLFE